MGKKYSVLCCFALCHNFEICDQKIKQGLNVLWLSGVRFCDQDTDNAYCACFAVPASTAAADSVPVFKVKAWRKQGQPLTEIVSKYKSLNADLNVLPFCSQFIPMDVINHPRLKSICYHPSLLPKHRGVNAINWWVILQQCAEKFWWLAYTKYMWVCMKMQSRECQKDNFVHETGNLLLLSCMDKDLIWFGFHLSCGKGMRVPDDLHNIYNHLSAIHWQSWKQDDMIFFVTLVKSNKSLTLYLYKYLNCSENCGVSIIHSYIPLACAECDDSLLFSGASSIPLCYVLFPATLLHQLFVHPL